MKHWLLRLLVAVALVVGQTPAFAQVSDVVKSGTIAVLDGTVSLVNINGRPGVSCVIGGTFSATLTPEVSVNDSVWEVTQFYDLSAKARVATTTASGSYVILGTAGMTAARIRASTYTSGTVTVTIRAGAGPLSLPADVMSSAPAGTENGLVVRTIPGTGTSATEVQGTAASGSAAVGKPVQIGGIQTNGTMQTIKVDGNGYINAILGASSSVIGAVTQGASGSYVNSWGVQGAALAGGAAVGAPVLAGLKDASGNAQTLKGDANGLFVTLQASSSTIGNVGIVSGSAEIGQVAQGTATASAGAWPVKVTDGTDTALVDGNGYLTVTQGTATASGGAWYVQFPSAQAVSQAASTSLPWPAMLSNGSGTQQGTSAAPLRTDPTGTTTQPISQASSASIPFSTFLTNGSGVGLTAVTVQASGAFGVTQGASSSLPWSTFLTDSDGTGLTAVTVQGSGSFTTSGTSTVTQGASSSLPWPAFLTDSDGTGLTALTVQGSGSFTTSGTSTVTQGASSSLPWSTFLTDSDGTGLTALTVQGSGSFTTSGTSTVTQGASSSLPWPTFLTDSDGTGLTSLAVQASGSFPVTGTFWQATQPVSGTVTVTQGASISSGIPWSVIRKSADGGAESDNWVTPVDSAAKSISGDTPVQLYTTGAPKITGLWIQPTNGTIYLGGSAVTPSTGLPIVSGQTFTLPCTPCGAHYATSSATVNTVVVPVLSN